MRADIFSASGFGKLLSLLMLVAALPSLAAERFDLKRTLTNLGYSEVPLRRTAENHLFLFAQVAGRRRSCLVDTGWSFTTISTNTAVRLAESNLIPQLTLGNVRLTNETVRVANLLVQGQPAPYDLVLGCDFLQRHRAIIDCGANRLYLLTAPALPAQRDVRLPGLRKAGFQEVELKSRVPAALVATATINDSQAEWLIDSGAMWSCLDAAVARSLKLQAQPTLNRMRGAATPDQRPFGVARLQQWRLGDLQMPETSVAVFDLGDWGMGPAGRIFPEVSGILGGAELHKFRAVIDCGGAKLWLRPPR